jgi:hypothetical protein
VATTYDIQLLGPRAERRLRAPRHRGAIQPVEAARRQLALLSVADAEGQGRIYWLIELPGRIIREARYLAFGSRASHALLDCLCDLATGAVVEDACRMRAEQVESLLRDDPATPAVPSEDTAFLDALLEAAAAAAGNLEILPKPIEAPVFTRKREAEWDERDRAWFGLKYLRQIGKVDALIGRVLRARFPQQPPAYRIVNLNDAAQVEVAIGGLHADQLPTIAQVLTDALSSELHPHLRAEVTAL